MSPRLSSVSDTWRRVVVADLRRLADLRADVAATLTRWGLEEAATQAVVLSVHELVANAAEHAYRGRDPGPVVVELRLADDVVTATVQDSGRWKHRDPAAQDGRGRGLVLVRALTQDVAVWTGTTGTSVRFRLAPP
jgi:anti-sigma regulatory factor (Ser/Thr protein kinase)